MMKIKRVAAFLVDTNIAALICGMPPMIISSILNFWFNDFYLIMGMYYLLIVFKDMMFGNASIGKKLFGLEVLKENGEKPSVITVVLRNALFPLWMLDGVLLFCTGKKIMDMIFKTKVCTVRNKGKY